MARVAVNDGFWAGRTVLVTGHTGFKGAWLALWLQHLGARVTGFALAPEHATGAFAAMSPWSGLDDRRGDLRDADAVRDVMAAAAPTVVFHLGAQAVVSRGFADPRTTFETNVAGTVNVLGASVETPSVRAVVVVTSDKVYRPPVDGRLLVESDPLGGLDPYSASKSCAELVVSSWRAARPAGPPVSTARAGNVIGGGDAGEARLVPDILRAADRGERPELRRPEATRPWQFVLAPLEGYLRLGRALVEDPGGAPPALNFGPDGASVTVAEVADRVLRLVDGQPWRPVPRPDLPETTYLALDAALARTTLGWAPRLDLDESLRWTVQWHVAQRRGEAVREVSLHQLDRYLEATG